MRAKFKCVSVDRRSNDATVEVVYMEPVVDPINEEWTQAPATPSGLVQLTISNPKAFGFFSPGGFYELPFATSSTPSKPEPAPTVEQLEQAATPATE